MSTQSTFLCIFGLVAITITNEIQIDGNELQVLMQRNLGINVKLFVINNSVDFTAYTRNGTHKFVPVFLDEGKNHILYKVHMQNCTKMVSMHTGRGEQGGAL